jgi:ankyrin repeat protein
LVAQGIEIKTGMKRVTLKRSLAAIIALSLVAVPAPVLAQGLGMNASDGEAFLKAIREDDANKAVQLASAPGTRVVNYRGYDGETPLNVVIRKRELDWVGFMLNKGADPNVADGKGDIPLTIAAEIGFEEAAGPLIGRGAKVDGTNRRGETALAVAVQQRQPRMVELLLRAGANPDKGDHVTGYTPRDYAKRDTRNPQLLKLIETIKPATKKAVAGPKIN